MTESAAAAAETKTDKTGKSCCKCGRDDLDLYEWSSGRAKDRICWMCHWAVDRVRPRVSTHDMATYLLRLFWDKTFTMSEFEANMNGGTFVDATERARATVVIGILERAGVVKKVAAFDLDAAELPTRWLVDKHAILAKIATGVGLKPI